MSGSSPDVPQHGLPPYPWPNEPDSGWHNCTPGPDDCLGGTGTAWIFKVSALRARATALALDWAGYESLSSLVSAMDDAVGRWLGRPCYSDVPDDSDPDPYITWINPRGADDMTSIQVARVTVHATLGSFEGLSHVLHFAAKSGYSGTPDAAEMAALAASVRTHWVAWFNDSTTHYSTSTPRSDQFHTGLIYDKITATLITQESGNPPPKPTTDIGGQVASIPASGAGSAHGTGTGWALPNEVALCLSLRTDVSSRSTRGRIYLGGLVQGVTQGNQTGLFVPTSVEAVAQSFGLLFVDAIHTDSGMNWELHILSRRYATSRGVGGVSVGQVPDSQRGRRARQPENKLTVWGS